MVPERFILYIIGIKWLNPGKVLLGHRKYLADLLEETGISGFRPVDNQIDLCIRSNHENQS